MLYLLKLFSKFSHAFLSNEILFGDLNSNAFKVHPLFYFFYVVDTPDTTFDNFVINYVNRYSYQFDMIIIIKQIATSVVTNASHLRYYNVYTTY